MYKTIARCVYNTEVRRRTKDNIYVGTYYIILNYNDQSIYLDTLHSRGVSAVKIATIILL